MGDKSNLGGVSNEEELSRYIYETSKYNTATGKINHRIFLPRFNDKTESYETSMFRTLSISRNSKKIWKLGSDFSDGRKPIARGITTAKEVRSIKPLEVVPETSPHPLHANIVNWPHKKEEQMDLARSIREVAWLDSQE